jgi:hypothetical protein
MNVRYRVELSQAERGELTAMLSKGKRAARKLKRAHRTTPPPRSSCTCSHALRASIHSIVIQISITPQRVIDKSAASRRTRPNSESINRLHENTQSRCPSNRQRSHPDN